MPALMVPTELQPLTPKGKGGQRHVGGDWDRVVVRAPPPTVVVVFLTPLAEASLATGTAETIDCGKHEGRQNNEETNTSTERAPTERAPTKANATKQKMNFIRGS